MRKNTTRTCREPTLFQPDNPEEKKAASNWHYLLAPSNKFSYPILIYTNFNMTK